MQLVTYRNRRAVQIENDALRVTVLFEGGHIAEILHKPSGVNPLWTPPWPSIEPSQYDPERHPEYGLNNESRLLSGIMGHNVCMDIFGAPSPEEEAAGLDVHGEASTAPFLFDFEGDTLICRADLLEAGLVFVRRLRLSADGRVVQISESVNNLSGTDRPIAWTQHVTLGPPFLEKGVTRFRNTGKRSKVFEEDFAGEYGLQKPSAEFDWPNVPFKDGSTGDLSVYTNAAKSGGFTTTLMDPERSDVGFTAWSPTSKLAFGYVWRQRDFPWLGRWEENLSRDQPPWNGETITVGMEFGASPMPETRRQMVERGRLFGAPTFRWIPAESSVEASYCAFIATATAIPEEVSWNGADAVTW
jgi:hypothetical protein